MPKTVTVPSTLKGEAASMWRSVFLSAYDGTCAERSDRDACAASIAWSQVKKKYKKGKDGTWVAKAGDPAIGPVSPVVDVPGAGGFGAGFEMVPEEGFKGTKAQQWRMAFVKALQEDCRNSDTPVECARAKANAAVGKLQERGMSMFDDYPQTYIERKDYSAEKRREMAGKGQAMKDGSFPIRDCEDVSNAVSSLGRTNKSRRAVIRHIRERAKSLGCELTPVLQEKFVAWDRYLDKYVKRIEANAADESLISRMGDQPIIRPDEYSSDEWARLPLSERTVRGEARRRIIERNYAQAVEDAQILAGWKAQLNHYHPEEHIFSKHIDTDAGPVLVRAVLVRPEDGLEWYLQPVSTFASGSLLMRMEPDKVRHLRG